MIKYWYYRLMFTLAPYLPLRGPVHVDIELAGKCQLACTMCPFGDHEDGSGSFDSSKQGMMSFDMATKALKEARKSGAMSVKFNFRGEPGLCKHLAYMVWLAKDLKYTHVMINTNLTAFNEKRLKELCDAGLDLLIVSVDGATAKTYESIRIKGDFQKLLANLLFIRNLGNRPKVRIQMTVQDKNRLEEQLMDDRFGHLCDELKFGAIRGDNSGERKRCPQPFQRIIVMWDGSVGLCCHNWFNNAVVGKYPDNSLKEIWNSKESKRLRKLAKHPEKGEPCKTCLIQGSYK